MSFNTCFEHKTTERDGLTFRVEYHYDESPDLSYLGEYTSERGPWTIDRRNRWLLGDWIEDSKTFTSYDEVGKFFEDHPEFEDYGDYPEEDEEGNITAIEQHYAGYEILASVRSTYERHSYEYFQLPEWDRPSNDLSRDDAIKACLADYQRIYDAERNEWYPMGIVVSLILDGEEVADASLWGIESDAGDSYITEVIDDLISECKEQAAASIEKYEGIVARLKALKDDAE